MIMDPFMGFYPHAKYGTESSNKVLENVDYFLSNSSFELSDLSKLYGNNFLSEYERSESNQTENVGSLRHGSFANLGHGIEGSPHDKSEQQLMTTCIQENATSLPENAPLCSVYLTPVPSPLPYSNVSSPESSRKKTGRPEKSIEMAEKVFQRKKRFMTKAQRKIESNNISSLKSRRRQKRKLNELKDKERKLAEKNIRLSHHTALLEKQIASLKIRVMNHFVSTEDKVAIETN